MSLFTTYLEAEIKKRTTEQLKDDVEKEIKLAIERDKKPKSGYTNKNYIASTLGDLFSREQKERMAWHDLSWDELVDNALSKIKDRETLQELIDEFKTLKAGKN